MRYQSLGAFLIILSVLLEIESPKLSFSHTDLLKPNDLGPQLGFHTNEMISGNPFFLEARE